MSNKSCRSKFNRENITTKTGRWEIMEVLNLKTSHHHGGETYLKQKKSQMERETLLCSST
jgi:hypothetical protein